MKCLTQNLRMNIRIYKKHVEPEGSLLERVYQSIMKGFGHIERLSRERLTKQMKSEKRARGRND